MTTQTPDAVREAASRLRVGIDGLCSRRRVYFSDQDWSDLETLIDAALDSRAGDAGKVLVEVLDKIASLATPAGNVWTGSEPLWQTEIAALAENAVQAYDAATPAPAVDAREVYAVDDQGLFCRNCGRTSVRHYRTKAGNFCRNPEDFPEAITPAVDAVPAGEVEPCTFADCPPGLFRWNGLLCFKSEYSTKAGQPDAYCVDSGEYFWGGTSGDLEKRRKLMVQPIASAALSHGEGRK